MIKSNNLAYIKRYCYVVTSIWIAVVGFLVASSLWFRLFPSSADFTADCFVSILPTGNNQSASGRTLFITIISARANVERRHFLRTSSWLRLYLEDRFTLPDGDWNIKYKFFIGNRDRAKDATLLSSQINNEQGRHDDIVELDMVDEYRALSLKLALVRQWVVQSQVEFDYLIKCDDDVWLHLPHLLDFIDSSLLSPTIKHPLSSSHALTNLKARRCRVIVGHIITQMHPLRDESKWADKAFPVDRYFAVTYADTPIH